MEGSKVERFEFQNGKRRGTPRQFCEECEKKGLRVYGTWKNIRNFVEAEKVDFWRRNFRDCGAGRHWGLTGQRPSPRLRRPGEKIRPQSNKLVYY